MLVQLDIASLWLLMGIYFSFSVAMFGISHLIRFLRMRA